MPSLAGKRFSLKALIAPAIAILAVAALVPLSGALRPAAAETAQVVPAAEKDAPLASAPGSEMTVLAGGCFWGVQGVFQHVKGVISAVSGYSGGEAGTAQYHTVSTGLTGHAELVQVTFDPSQITYGKLLQIYFSVAHDPTQVNRQGPDTGTQYRSAIFAASSEQADIAKAYIAQLDKAGVFTQPIATEVNTLKAFYPAEDYHQNYATIHPDSAYIFYNDLPKIANLKRLFPDVYRDDPVLVNVASN